MGLNSGYRQNHQTKLGAGMPLEELLSPVGHFVSKYGENRLMAGKDVQNLVEGVPVAPGVAVGLAVVMQTPDDLRLVRSESIIICSSISPLYSIVFSMVRGIVSEKGGVMSSSAILARENDLPAISRVRSARRIISDGDIIRIDGTDGFVEFVLRSSIKK